MYQMCSKQAGTESTKVMHEYIYYFVQTADSEKL